MKARLIIALAIVLSAWQLKAQVTPPEPLAGKTVTKDYITQNLVYPETDLQQGNSGKVVIGMNIDAQGQVSQYTVKSTFSEAAAPIALRLVKSILWKPATIAGLPTDYSFEYEVDFNAKSYKRYWKHRTRLEAPLSLEADTSNIVYEYKQLNEVAKPYFADGLNMGKYIVKNLKYPAEAKERELQGTVRLNFVVETDGTVSNIVVVNSVGGGCDQEAIRLLQETIWTPAQKNEKYVRSFNNQDITFSIGNREFQDGYNF